MVLQTSEMEAAALMMGMSHSGLRETVTLFEGAPSVAAQHSRFPSYNNHQQYQQYGGAGVGSNGDDSGEMLVEDEALVMLDRLRDVTQRAVQLQVLFTLFLQAVFFSQIACAGRH